MPRFLFDTHDGDWTRDDVGVECANIDAARVEANRALAKMASSAVSYEADHRTITVVARNDERQPVYTASLTFAGLMVES